MSAVYATLDDTLQFVEVTPQLLERRMLLRRTDTKFLVAASDLPRLLPRLCADYGLLRAGGRAVARYETLYFDSPRLCCFNAHRVGRRPRHKVRIRHYVDRQLSYLEVKTKTNHNRTRKQRLRRAYYHSSLTEVDRGFVGAHSGLDGAEMWAQLWTNFHRLTLVGLASRERVTIDTGLEFRAGSRRESIPNVAIVEVKQERFSACTPVMWALRELGCRPASASKYCTGTALLRSDVRVNRFMRALSTMESLNAQ